MCRPTTAETALPKIDGVPSRNTAGRLPVQQRVPDDALRTVKTRQLSSSPSPSSPSFLYPPAILAADKRTCQTFMLAWICNLLPFFCLSPAFLLPFFCLSLPVNNKQNTVSIHQLIVQASLGAWWDTISKLKFNQQTQSSQLRAYNHNQETPWRQVAKLVPAGDTIMTGTCYRRYRPRS